MPTDTQVCCLGCEHYNTDYCKLHKKEVEEQDFCNLWRGKEFTFDYENDNG